MPAWLPRASRRPRTADTVEIPDSLAPQLAAALPASGIEALYSHQLEALDAVASGNAIVTSGTASRQVAVLQPPGPRRAGAGRPAPRALPVSDQGPRPGPGAEAVGARPAAASPRDLRRRHAARRPAADPAPLEPDPHQPRHAPCRDPAPPQELGRLPRQPRLGGRGRGPHLPGRVRLARRERAAPAAPGRAPSTAPSPRFILASATIANPVELAERLVGEPFRAGRLRRRSARRARRIGMWNPPVHRPRSMTRRSVLSRGRRAARRPGERGDADDLLPAQPARDRADPAVHAHAARGAGPPAARGADRALPGRLHAAAAPRDRGPPRGRRSARRRRHRRARAGHRHRRARRGDLRHLPRHGREPAADVGPRGPAQRGLALYIAGEDALDQFFCRHPDEFLERPVEAAILDHENERIQLAHLLAAAYELPLSDAGRGGLWRAAGGSAPTPWWRSASCGAAARAATCRAARASPPATSRCARPRRTRSRSSSATRGELLGAVEAERRVHHRAPRRRLPAPGALVRGRASSTSRRAARWSSRFDGDWYTQPKKETEVFIERIAERARRRSGVELELRRGVGHRAGDGLPAQAPRPTTR